MKNANQSRRKRNIYQKLHRFGHVALREIQNAFNMSATSLSVVVLLNVPEYDVVLNWVVEKRSESEESQAREYRSCALTVSSLCCFVIYILNIDFENIEKQLQYNLRHSPGRESMSAHIRRRRSVRGQQQQLDCVVDFVSLWCAEFNLTQFSPSFLALHHHHLQSFLLAKDSSSPCWSVCDPCDGHRNQKVSI